MKYIFLSVVAFITGMIFLEVLHKPAQAQQLRLTPDQVIRDCQYLQTLQK